MKKSQKIDDLPVLVTWWSDASAMLSAKLMVLFMEALGNN